MKLKFLIALLFYSCSTIAQSLYPADALPAVDSLENIRVALVLGGGGARGVAHAGVIEVLETHHIPIDIIIGSSVGGVIGALYADDPCAARLKKKIIRLKRSDLLDISWYAGIKMLWGSMSGPVEGKALKGFLKKTLHATAFSQLKIPLAVVTTEIDNGKTFVIRSGPLNSALQASSAIPMVFSPVQLYGRTLVDGGVASPVPVEIAKQFSPKIIIAVDIGTSPDFGPVSNAYQLGMRSLHISYFNLAQSQIRMADIVIHPSVDEYSMFDDTVNDELYEAGRQAALEALPEIKKALQT